MPAVMPVAGWNKNRRGDDLCRYIKMCILFALFEQDVNVQQP